MSGAEYNTWKVADLKAQLKAKVTNLYYQPSHCSVVLSLVILHQ